MDDDSKLLYPNPEICLAHAFPEASPDHTIAKVLETYRSLGRIIGYALTKSHIGVTFPVHFPLPVYKILLGLRITVSDLMIISPSAYRTLEMFCLMPAESLEDSSFPFSIGLSTSEEYEICPNGKDTILSTHNRIEFLSAVSRFYLCCGGNDGECCSNSRPLRELLLGVQHAIPRSTFSFLSPLALQIMIEGEREIDVEQWKLYTRVSLPKFVPSNDVVDWFWSVVSRMSLLNKQRLLVFSTGSATLPSNGFQDLSPPFSLHVDPSKSSDSLPEAHTCQLMLVIPRYSSESKLEEKLLIAITETTATTMGMV
jgi:hypothetical protein